MAASDIGEISQLRKFGKSVVHRYIQHVKGRLYLFDLILYVPSTIFQL